MIFILFYFILFLNNSILHAFKKRGEGERIRIYMKIFFIIIIIIPSFEYIQSINQ